MVKSLDSFLSKLQQVLYEYNFFLLLKFDSISPVHLQRIMKKVLFLHLLKVSIDHILITLSLEKESIVLEKSLEKVLSFGSKSLYEP